MSPAAQAAVRAAGQKPRAHPALDRLQWFLLAVATLLVAWALYYCFLHEFVSEMASPVYHSPNKQVVRDSTAAEDAGY